MKEIQELIKRVEVEINKTPTGELRNLLCDANIVLHQQALNIAAVVGQSEQLKAFADYAQKRIWEDGDKDLSEFVEEFLRL